MTADVAAEPASGVGAAGPELSDRLTVRPLSVVADGEEFVVGDPERNVYVLLPAIGVRAIELLRTGATLGEVRTALADAGTPDVEVVDFASSLVDLGLATVAGDRSGDEHLARHPTRWERRAGRNGSGSCSPAAPGSPTCSVPSARAPCCSAGPASPRRPTTCSSSGRRLAASPRSR